MFSACHLAALAAFGYSSKLWNCPASSKIMLLQLRLKRLATVYNRPVPSVGRMLRLLALVGLVQVAAQTVGGGTGGTGGTGTVGGSTGVDLSQINRDFHAACARGDQERAAALLGQGTSRFQNLKFASVGVVTSHDIA